MPSYLFGSLSCLGALFVLLPSVMKPVYVGWLKVAHFIGKIVTVVILALAYYLVMTPSAVVKRLLSGRPLPTKPDRKAASYWVARTELAQPRERFLKRY